MKLNWFQTSPFKEKETGSRWTLKLRGYLIGGIFFLGLLPWLSGCGPAVVAGGATAGYKVATDPRSLGRQTDDATLTAKVKLALLKDPITKARKIDVDTVEGVVTLTGIVETEAQKLRAEEIAHESLSRDL